MRLVILESPYSGDVQRNKSYARAALRDCILRGESPYASHLLYTQRGVLNDANPIERKLGIELGFAWHRAAEATVVYKDLGISFGMNLGIDAAEAAGRPVEERFLPAGLWDCRASNPTPERIQQIRQRYAEFKQLPTIDALKHHYAATWLEIGDLLTEIDRLKSKEPF